MFEKLRKYGINTTMLNQLEHLVTYNPDQLFIGDDSPLVSPVSPLLLRHCKQKKKVYKVLKNLGIYNIILVNTKPGKYVYLCKTSKGDVISSVVDKESGYTKRKSFASALLVLISMIENDIIEDVDPSLIPVSNNSAKLTLDTIDTANIPEDNRNALRSLIEGIKNGTIETDLVLSDNNQIVSSDTIIE
jgi:hypothetical protein